MEVNRKGFPEVTLDNDEVFFSQMIGVIESVDEYSCLEITKTPNSYHFRIAPSLPKYTNMLLQEIINLSNLFQIHLDISKSIKTTSIIYFSINYN